jgi:hypothetical protein
MVGIRQLTFPIRCMTNKKSIFAEELIQVFLPGELSRSFQGIWDIPYIDQKRTMK